MQKTIITILLIKTTISSQNGEIDTIEQLLFFIILSILIGLLLLGIKHITTIPYTPMLLLTGIIIGIFSKNLGLIGLSMQHVVKLSSHTLLFVFIPPLIFESAFNIDVFIFLRSFWQILLLALPGVAMLSVMIAVIMKYILLYENLGWGESLTIGAIIAATDPVAVVSLLKEIGTSIKFNILLEGESLLNDGTAVVFFWVFMDMVDKGSFDLVSFVIRFFRLSAGGPILGLIIAIIFYQIMKNLLHSHVIFVILSIVVCYFTFFLSESDFLGIKVSGILALVVLGLYMGAKLKGRVVGNLEESMHVIWHFFAYILETILFLITGGYLGNFFASSEVSLRLNKNDIWKIIIFQILLFFSRGFILVVLSPLINKVGYKKLNWKDILIMTYGGLRGAIGLSLALFVATSHLKDKKSIEIMENFKNFQILCVFYVSITIAFTVLFNGLTIKYLIKGISFVKKGLMYEKMKIMMKQKLVMKSMNKLEEIKLHTFLNKTNWDKVERIMDFNKEIKNITNRIFILQDQELKDNHHRLDRIIDSLEVLLEKKIKKYKKKNKKKLKAKFDVKNDILSKKRISGFKKKKRISLKSNSKFDIEISKESKIDEIIQITQGEQKKTHLVKEVPNLIKSKMITRNTSQNSQNSENKISFQNKIFLTKKKNFSQKKKTSKKIFLHQF